MMNAASFTGFQLLSNGQGQKIGLNPKRGIQPYH